MITAKTGISNNPNAFEAGKEAAQIAKEKMGNVESQLLLASVTFPTYDQQEVLNGIHSVFENTPLVGGSPLGGICSDVEHKDEAVIVGAFHFEKTSFKTANIENVKQREFEAGKELGEKLKKDGQSPNVIILFTPSLGEESYVFNIDALLPGLKESIGNKTKIIGISTGNDLLMMGKMDQAKSFQYINSEVKIESVSAVGFFGDLNAQMVVSHGWQPIGLEAEVTKSTGSVIEEIDGKPAVDLYEKYLEKPKEELLSPSFWAFGGEGYSYPLGVIANEEDVVIKQPITITPAGGIVTLNPMPEGERIKIMAIQVDKMEEIAINASKKLLEKFEGENPDFVFISSCANRKLFSIPDQKKEISSIIKVIGENTAVYGLWGAGEIGIQENQNKWLVLNETLALLGLKE